MNGLNELSAPNHPIVKSGNPNRVVSVNPIKSARSIHRWFRPGFDAHAHGFGARDLDLSMISPQLFFLPARTTNIRFPTIDQSRIFWIRFRKKLFPRREKTNANPGFGFEDLDFDVFSVLSLSKDEIRISDFFAGEVLGGIEYW